MRWPTGRVRTWAILGILALAAAADAQEPPGGIPKADRRRAYVGSLFNPGAAGPGIDSARDKTFLDGALDRETGWPLVFLDHFAPKPGRLDRFWVVRTRDCRQRAGTDPWPCLEVSRFGPDGRFERRDPRELLGQAAGHPVFIQVQGNLTTPDKALGGLLWTHTWLDRYRALPPDAVVVAFDWPSESVSRSEIRDVNEKARRADVAAFHLARFIQALPTDARICVFGQSFGVRVTLGALHLLGGGELAGTRGKPASRLAGHRADLQLRAVVLAGAADHDWLDPGKRFDRALSATSGLLNLYNRRDRALLLYPLLGRPVRHRSLGRIGLTQSDFDRLGPSAACYAERDVREFLGPDHTLLDAVANPEIARAMAPYTWTPAASTMPPPPPPVATPRPGFPNADRPGPSQRRR